MLIAIQERVDHTNPGFQHIVSLIGFCFELPTVATILEYCDGGDLLHRLDSMKPRSAENARSADHFASRRRERYRREQARFSRDEGLSASEPGANFCVAQLLTSPAVLSMPRTELLRGLASTMEESTETSGRALHSTVSEIVCSDKPVKIKAC